MQSLVAKVKVGNYHQTKLKNMQEAIFSTTVPAKGKTYFFDVKQAQGGNQSKYIQITESRMQDDKRVRSTIVIFPSNLEAFTQAFEQAKQNAV